MPSEQAPFEPPRRPRLVAADGTSRSRVAAGSLVLVGAASVGFWVLGRLGASPRVFHAAERAWAEAAVRALRLKLDVDGMHHVAPGQSYLVVALHEGFADVLALLRLPLPLRFVVRDELFSWRALARYLRAADHIEIAESRDLVSLRRLFVECRASLATGESVVIFPQGSILGVEVAFAPGAFRLATRLGAPVLPVVLTGSHRVWEHPYSPLVRLDQRVFMRVLPPIPAGDLSEARARELEREMKRIALEEATAPVRRFDPDRDGWWDGYRFDIDPDFPDLASRLAVRRAGSRR